MEHYIPAIYSEGMEPSILIDCEFHINFAEYLYWCFYLNSTLDVNSGVNFVYGRKKDIIIEHSYEYGWYSLSFFCVFISFFLFLFGSPTNRTNDQKVLNILKEMQTFSVSKQKWFYRTLGPVLKTRT